MSTEKTNNHQAALMLVIANVAEKPVTNQRSERFSMGRIPLAMEPQKASYSVVCLLITIPYSALWLKKNKKRKNPAKEN